jgi:hypothetical protein
MSRLNLLVAIILSLCVVSSLGFNLKVAQAAAKQISHKLKQTQSFMFEDVQRDTPSASCISAFLAVNQSGCLPNFDHVDFNTINYNGICSVCPALIGNFFLQCRPFIANDDQFAAVSFLLNLICTKEGDQYCLPTFGKFLDLVSNTSVDPTQDELTGICSPCFAKIIRLLFTHTEFSVDPEHCGMLTGREKSDCEFNARVQFAKNIDLLCTRAQGKFCILEVGLHFFDVFDQYPCGDMYKLNRTQQQELTCNNKTSIALCSSLCRRKLFFKGFLLSQDLNILQTIGLLNFVCDRDTSGEYCLVKATRAFQDFSNAAACPDNITTIPPASTISPSCPLDQTCKSSAETLINEIGCCFKPYEAYAVSINQSQFFDIAEQISKGCQISIDSPCPLPRGRKIRRTLFLLGLVLDYLNLRRDIIKAQIQRDLAAYFGITPNDVSIDITIHSSSKRGSGTGDAQLDVSFSGWSDNESDNFASDFDTSSKDGTLVLPSFESAYGAANPLSSYTISDTMETASASFLVLSILPILSLIFAMI